jgi:predicted PurR-regulated permease PerM
MPEIGRRALYILTLALVIATIVTLAPLWAPLVLAAWTADVLRPMSRRLERLFRGKRRAVAATVMLFVALALVPITIISAAVVSGAEELIQRLHAALEGKQSLATVLAGSDGAAPPTFRDWAALAGRHGAQAWQWVTSILRASAAMFLAALVFLITLSALLVSGPRSYRTVVKYSPIPRRALHRFTVAFRETGRALIIGAGGSALVQAITATIAYAIIGVPNYALLGPLTGLCAIVPVIGSGLVWIPLSIELAIGGDIPRSIAVFAVGLGVIGMVDNVVRPILARRAHLKLPTSVVLVSMVGGIAAFGATGVVLGPLFVRLAAEGLAIARDERWFLPRRDLTMPARSWA